MKLSAWLNDFVEIRILGSTGGFQTGGVLRELEEPLLIVGDAILDRDTEVEVLDCGTLRVDWTPKGQLAEILESMGYTEGIDYEVDEDEETFEISLKEEEDIDENTDPGSC